MSINYAEAFSNAFINVIPQLGFADVKLVSEQECGRKIEAPGVIAIIGIIGDLHGNVIFAMSEDSAKKVAGTMMCMEVEEFDELAQSAVSELSNMLAANACIELSMQEITADISTPTLMYGAFTATASFDRVIRIEMVADTLPFDIYVSVERK